MPILVIASENSDSYYMVMSLILFLGSFGTTLLIFVPKVIANRKEGNRRMSMLMRRAVESHRNATGRVGTVEEIRRRVSSRERETQSIESGEEMGTEGMGKAAKLAEFDDLDEKIAAQRKVLDGLKQEQKERERALSGPKEDNGTRSVSFADNCGDSEEEPAPK